MAAVLGLRGTGNFSSDERPMNWREMILYLNPNGDAPLTALLSLLKNEGTDSSQFHWWEKRLPTQRFALNGTVGSTITSLVVDSGAKDCVAGTLLLHESDGEVLRVTSTPTSDTALEVERSWGAVAAGTLTDDDFFTIVGNVNEEGADPPSARAYSPTKFTNYTEIFRTSLYLTRSARREKLRWDNQGPYREATREALALHSIEMEKAAIWGEAVESTGPKGLPMRSTQGIKTAITTNKGGAWSIAGLLDEDTLDAQLEILFRYGTNEKLVLAGSTWIRAITTLGKRNGTIEMAPDSTTYGMAIVKYITPFGTLMIKNHPLFSQHPVWRKDALFVDTRHIVCRPLDDTMFVKNRQSNGEDASMDEYLTDLGFVGNGRAFSKFDGLFDKFRDGGSFENKSESSVFVDGDKGGDDLTTHLGGFVVILLDELHDVDTMLTKSRTDWGSWISSTGGEI